MYNTAILYLSLSQLSEVANELHNIKSSVKRLAALNIIGTAELVFCVINRMIWTRRRIITQVKSWINGLMETSTPAVSEDKGKIA